MLNEYKITHLPAKFLWTNHCHDRIQRHQSPNKKTTLLHIIGKLTTHAYRSVRFQEYKQALFESTLCAAPRCWARRFVFLHLPVKDNSANRTWPSRAQLTTWQSPLKGMNFACKHRFIKNIIYIYVCVCVSETLFFLCMNKIKISFWYYNNANISVFLTYNRKGFEQSTEW